METTGTIGNGKSFNLSILECKFNLCRLARTAEIVLIYPYWNVNLVKWARSNKKALVLIYPYWNANDTIPETFTKRVFDTQWGWMVYYFHILNQTNRNWLFMSLYSSLKNG